MIIKYYNIDYKIKGVIGNRVILEPVSYEEAKKKYRRTNPSFKLIKNRNGISIQIDGKRINVEAELNKFFDDFMEV